MFLLQSSRNKIGLQLKTYVGEPGNTVPIRFSRIEGKVEEVRITSENEYYLFLSKLGVYKRRKGSPLPQNLNELPEDALRGILSVLPPDEQAKARLVSTTLRNVSEKELIHRINSGEKLSQFLTEKQLIGLLSRNGGDVYHLDLEAFSIGGPVQLIKSLPNLKFLSLKGHKIGAEGAWAFAASENLRGLKELNLSDNDIGAEGTRALAASGNLRGLNELDLSDNRMALKGQGPLPPRKA